MQNKSFLETWDADVNRAFESFGAIRVIRTGTFKSGRPRLLTVGRYKCPFTDTWNVKARQSMVIERDGQKTLYTEKASRNDSFGNSWMSELEAKYTLAPTDKNLEDEAELIENGTTKTGLKKYQWKFAGKEHRAFRDSSGFLHVSRTACSSLRPKTESAGEPEKPAPVNVDELLSNLAE